MLNGDHGRPHIVGVHPSAPLILQALSPQGAKVSEVVLQDAESVALVGLLVDGGGVIDPGAVDREQFLVVALSDTRAITLKEVVVQSAFSSESWDESGWAHLTRSGVDLRGSDSVVEGCTVHNIYHALSVRGDGARVVGNLVDNFAGDGIRGLGSNSVYAWNTVRDAYIDEYEVQHDDAFQAYNLGPNNRINNVQIHHNRFIVFADPITPFVEENHLVATLMQGVVITDGYADGWVVENNLVVTSQAHGITLYGARNCRVQNNTVVAHPDIAGQVGPWVRLTDQSKTGEENFNNVIRNNLSAMLTPWDYDSTSVVENNLQIEEPTALFLNAAALDFHLKAGAAAVNAGVTVDVPAVDLDGAPRVQGGVVDVGAFERSP